MKQVIELEERPVKTKNAEAFAELERGIYAALETYSNVHRGSGHFSMVTTHLFERARGIVLEYLGLEKNQYSVIFCSPRSAEIFKAQLPEHSYQILSGREFGLSLGVTALTVSKKVLAKVAPFHAGGGTARLIAKDWVVWAKAPEKFEAGTPAIINIIAFARALQMIQRSGKDIFLNSSDEKLTATEILYLDELEELSGRELLNKLRQTQIGRDVSVPTMEGIRSFVNLDNSASTPTFAPIWNAFRRTLRQPEQVKQEIIQEVKTICADTMNAPRSRYEVIFTSNATEAINLAAENLSRESDNDSEPVVLNTLLEHSSNDLPWRMIPNGSLIRLSVDNEGFIDIKELENLLIAYNLENRHGTKRIKLVAVSGASNVLGVCNNLVEISRIVHQYDARLLVDAAQLVAHRKVDIDGSGIDYLAFSAHKVYAPFGCGVLVVRKGLLNFKSDELKMIQSSGEENAAGIAALGKALSLLRRIGMDLIEKEEQALTSRVLRRMSQIQGLETYGIKDPESASFANKLGVIPFVLKNKMATEVGKELAIAGGIGVRTGCHCAHINVKHILQVGPSLERFQRMIVTLFPKLSLPGVVRVSLGIENSEEEVDKLIRVLSTIANKAKTSSAHHETTALSRKVLKQQMDDFVREAGERVYIQNSLESNVEV